MFNEMEFGSGTVMFDDFKINVDKSLKEQIDLLKEDLFQVEYSEGHIIDVGWYPSFEEDGNFKIVVISEYDWENPTYVKKCNDMETLMLYMKESVAMVNELISRKGR